MTEQELLRRIEQAARDEVTFLDLSRKKLTALPPEIGKLQNLQELVLQNTPLTALPPEIGKLQNLQELDLRNNQLTTLPEQIGQLQNLQTLKLDGNPLTSPPPEVVEQGLRAILAYLRELARETPQWVSKLLVVGEGGVGKTQLLRRLRGEPYVKDAETTHGIEIREVPLAHPTRPDVTMHLNAWDFGGQQIYHATHQFFLTTRSLFVVAWNARLGWEQGKLPYWLDTIEARAPESPVLLVATHIDERDADLPLADLKRSYPQIIGQCEISNETGEGIDTLRQTITTAAAALPLMGEKWPTTWLQAAEAARAKPEKYITPRVFFDLLGEHGVRDTSAEVLARWLHELGDLLFFQDDDELNQLVILKPQWVSQYISNVLESKEVIKRDGIFTRDHMVDLWNDLEGYMQDHFLKLMEQFDLSYRTLENREISIVVERLSYEPPPYEKLWQAKAGAKEIAMKFDLNTTLPAGIPTYFIARSHRFTTHHHWRYGALFADGPERAHLGLVQAFPHDRFLTLTVRGPLPHNFFALLRDGLELTLRRFPGLNIDRRVPCPGHDGVPCPHEFSYNQLVKRLERRKYPVECPESLEDLDVRQLLFGLDASTLDQVIAKLDALEGKVADLRTLAQRQFTSLFQREQSLPESRCPNVFVLRPVDTPRWKKRLAGQQVELQLYCQAPGQWHPTREGGRYLIKDAARWIQQVAPYLNRLNKVLKFVMPLAGPWMGGMSAPDYEDLIEKDRELMSALVEKLPEYEKRNDMEPAPEVDLSAETIHVSGAVLRAVRALLDEKDPRHHWGGLDLVFTPEGHHLWLCEHHKAEYKA